MLLDILSVMLCIAGLLTVGIVFTAFPMYRAVQEIKQEESLIDKGKAICFYLFDICIENPLSPLFFSIMIGIPCLLGGILLILMIVFKIPI